MPEKTQEENKEEKHEDNVGMAVVAYFLFFVPLLTESKNDPFVKFHVKQSLVVLSLSIGFYILRIFLGYIPLIGRLLYIVYPILSLGIFVLFIIGIINALNSNMKELPYVGKYAEKWFKF
jgi:uncharacterized membrane protein